MFGKPVWFRQRTLGWGLVPATWQGWIYSFLWVLVIALPMIGLINQGKSIQSLIWMVFAIGVLAFDIRSLSRQLDQQNNLVPDDDLFVIDENETESARVATQKYELHIRD